MDVERLQPRAKGQKIQTEALPVEAGAARQARGRAEGWGRRSCTWGNPPESNLVGSGWAPTSIRRRDNAPAVATPLAIAESACEMEASASGFPPSRPSARAVRKAATVAGDAGMASRPCRSVQASKIPTHLA
jgi:hypothetical protein